MNYGDRIRPEDSSIISFVEAIAKGEYQIPTFQREVAWEKENVKKLWDSIFKFYPIGSLLLWKTDIPLQYHRRIGGQLLKNSSSGTYNYLLDGQQRATAIFLSLRGEIGDIAGKEQFNPLLYVDLSFEEQEDDENSYRDLFLYWDEIDDQGGKLKRNTPRKEKYTKSLIVPLFDIYQRMEELEKRIIEEGYSDYNSIPRQNLRKFDSILKSYRVSFIKLQGIEVKEVCDIFERVNREGKPLDVVDIIVAKTYIPPTDGKGFYLRRLLDGLRERLAANQYGKLSDFVIIQTVASIIMQLPDTKVYNVTNRYLPNIKAEEIEEIWDDFVKAMVEMVKFFKERLHLVGPNLIPYAYMYPAICNYFYKNKAIDFEIPKRWFWYKCFSIEELDSTTKLKREIEILESFKGGEPISWPALVIDKDMLRRQKYTARGAKSRAILSLMAYQKPCEFSDPDRDVLQTVYLQLGDQPNLHHFFPLNHLANHPDQATFAANRDSLMNIVFLPQIENLMISDKNPLVYLKEYMQDNPRFEEVLKRHMIPAEILDWVNGEATWGNYDEFIELRADLMLERLKELLPEIELRIIDSKTN